MIQGFFQRKQQDLRGRSLSSPNDGQILKTQEDVQILGSSREPDTRTYSYSILGNGRRFRSANTSLRDRIASQAGRSKSQSKLELQKEQVEQNTKESVHVGFKIIDSTSENLGKEKIHQEIQQVMRYFSTAQQQERFGKCRRCKKHGHFERTCTEEIKVSCIFCLASHSRTDCEKEKSCFNCKEPGHIARDCRVIVVKCKKCDKSGHDANTCGSLMLKIEFNQRNYTAQELRMIICLQCKQPGHPICYPIIPKSFPDRLYHSQSYQSSADPEGSSPYYRK